MALFPSVIGVLSLWQFCPYQRPLLGFPGFPLKSLWKLPRHPSSCILYAYRIITTWTPPRSFLQSGSRWQAQALLDHSWNGLKSSSLETSELDPEVTLGRETWKSPQVHVLKNSASKTSGHVMGKVALKISDMALTSLSHHPDAGHLSPFLSPMLLFLASSCLVHTLHTSSFPFPWPVRKVSKFFCPFFFFNYKFGL